MEKQVLPNVQLDILEVPETERITPTEQSEIHGKLFRRVLPSFSESTQFHRGSRGGTGSRLIAWSAVAALIDTLILFSVSCFLLLAFAWTMKAQMQVVLQIYEQSFFSYGVFAESILCFFYLVMLRTFLGFTVGEWACGLRLGNLKQRLQRLYGLRVIARTTLIFITGVLTLPLLSLLIGRDVAGLMVGLSLIEHR